MPGPTAMSATEQVAGYAAGLLDPRDVIEACLALIAGRDGAIRSFITVSAEQARAAAAASTGRWRCGRPCGPLDGVPIGIKDNIDVAGLPGTAGVEAFRSRMPERDADVVGRLRLGGAVILGKLNMDEGALGATCDNRAFGRCLNPLGVDLTPGGSSGGSAASVAAGFCPISLGTDTLGSVRVPASYCGIYGFKPSPDRISGSGLVPLSLTLDTVGALARTLEDVLAVSRLLLDPVRGPTSTGRGSARPGRIRLGIPRQVGTIDVAAEILAAFRGRVDALRAENVEVETVDLPDWEPAATRRAGLLIAEAEGAAYYSGELGADLAGVSAPFAGMLRYGAASADRVRVAHQRLDAVRQATLRVMHDVDALILPTTAQTAFRHGEPVPANQADLTALANAARAPAFSVPMVMPGLPAGVQLVGRPGDDERLMAITAALDPILRSRSPG